MTPESRANGRFKRWLVSRGLKFIRLALQPGVQAGWPDWIILLSGGRPLWVEMKDPALRGTDARSPQQKLRHRELEKLGYDVCTGYGSDEAIAAVVETMGSRAVPASGG